MKTIENPLQSKKQVQLEVISENKKVINRLSLCQQCRILCSCEHILVSLLVFLIGGSQFFVFTSFTGGFRRKGNWVFFTLGTMSWLLVVSFFIRSCIAICNRAKNTEEEEEDQDEEKEKKGFVQVCICIKTFYYDFTDVNGKYYLAKMYFAELFEHTQQVYSLVTIYLCLMPVGISSVVCGILAIELIINIWASFHIGSQEMRDRIILLDIITDLFCLGFPLLYIRLTFDVPIDINKMIFIMVYPVISVLSKLNDIWEDYFKMDLQRVINMKNVENNTRSSRRRKSILKLSHNKEMIEMQLKYFPSWLRNSFVMLNICFVLFFVSLCCFQLATQPSMKECSFFFTNEVWNGCQVPVPFCENVYNAKCDCSVLEINNYTQKTLPESFGNLSSLVKLGISIGKLEELPDGLGNNHQSLTMISVVGNKLQKVPASIGKLQYLIYLWLPDNQLTELPKNIGDLKNLMVLFVSDNLLTMLPESVGKLESMVNILIRRNRMTVLPDSIGKLENMVNFYAANNQLASLPKSIGMLKNLETLELSNNQLTKLPEGVGKLKTVNWLHLRNNNLTSLPENIGGIMSAINVDLRHNYLATLPLSVGEWNKIKYLYLAGNPLCNHLNIPNNLKEAEGLCEEQCSADCHNVFVGDGYCDDNGIYQMLKRSNANLKPKMNSGCNIASCEYDKGDCSF